MSDLEGNTAITIDDLLSWVEGHINEDVDEKLESRMRADINSKDSQLTRLVGITGDIRDLIAGKKIATTSDRKFFDEAWVETSREIERLTQHPVINEDSFLTFIVGIGSDDLCNDLHKRPDDGQAFGLTSRFIDSLGYLARDGEADCAKLAPEQRGKPHGKARTPQLRDGAPQSGLIRRREPRGRDKVCAGRAHFNSDQASPR